MPELPEVETVRRILGPQLTGRTIRKTTLLFPGIAAHPDPEGFIQGTEGRRILGVERHGKFLRFALDDGAALSLHLRMTGCLLRAPTDFPMEKHTHAVFELDDGSELRYTDLRRFGRFWLLAPNEEDVYTGMAVLGPDPFSPEATGVYLQARLSGSKRAIKSCLLDQGVLAGLGNIYTDESLFLSGIAPTRRACDLKSKEWEQLMYSIRDVLETALSANSMTPEEYLQGLGRAYRNGPTLQVYGRGGQPCARCGQPLEAIRLGGRTSCFCPHCQK